MNEDFLLNIIKNKQPDLYEKMQTEQFKISDEILRFRINYGIEIDEISDFLGMNFDEYHNYEYGLADESTEKYLEVLNGLKKYNTEIKKLYNNQNTGYHIVDIQKSLLNHQKSDALFYKFAQGYKQSIRTLTNPSDNNKMKAFSVNIKKNKATKSASNYKTHDRKMEGSKSWKKPEVSYSTGQL